MDKKNKKYMSKIKHLVDNGQSMAEAFLKVFETIELSSHKKTIDEILKHYSAQELQIGRDYFFRLFRDNCG